MNNFIMDIDGNLIQLITVTHKSNYNSRQSRKHYPYPYPGGPEDPRSFCRSSSLQLVLSLAHLRRRQQESSSMDGRTFGRGRRGPDRRGWRGTSPGERPSSGSPTASWPFLPRGRGKLCLCGLRSPLWLEIDIIKGASIAWH